MGESENESVVFPLVLYDGEREMDVGNIKIHETLNFKQFQMMLKETIGISYNHLTTYLVDSNKSKIPSERRKILITGKVNFDVLLRERNCYFLVVLKRSRRDRRRKPNKQSGGAFTPVVSPAYLLQLRRDHADLIDEQMSYMYGLHGYDLMRDDYMNAVAFWNPVYYSPLNASFQTVEEANSTIHGGRSRAFCEDCTNAEKQGKKAAFHFCVNDVVISCGFRSLVGPISRPK